MLQFKNGRFCAKGVSFTLPDGFHLICGAEGVYESALSARSPDMDIQFMWAIYGDCENGVETLSRYVEPETGYVALSDIMIVQVNGLAGAALFYRGQHIQVYEARFCIPSGGCLVFTAEVKDIDIQKAYEREDFRAALFGIQKDEE